MTQFSDRIVAFTPAHRDAWRRLNEEWLIADGFVERKRDEHDRRMVIVSICQPGEARLMEIRGKMQELVGEWAVNLSAADLRELNDSLHTITRVLGSTLQHSHE